MNLRLFLHLVPFGKNKENTHLISVITLLLYEQSKKGIKPMLSLNESTMTKHFSPDKSFPGNKILDNLCRIGENMNYGANM